MMFQESRLAHKYCIGSGLEIGGAAHNPFGLNALNVDVRQREVDHEGNKALHVDILASGDNISLPDGSQSFIVSSHVFEHLFDPIKALLEWDRLIKINGVIFMIIPHKERTFDKHAGRTALQHLVDDYTNKVTKGHEKNGKHQHDHVWITEDIVELINWVIDNLGIQWVVEEAQDIDDKVGNGFTVVVRKKGLILTSQERGGE